MQARENLVPKLTRTKLDVLEDSLYNLEKQLPTWDGLDSLGLSPHERLQKLYDFRPIIRDTFGRAVRYHGHRSSIAQVGVGVGLLKALEESGQRAFDAQLKYAFYGFVASKTFSAVELRNQRDLADLRYPTEWYPVTRELQRKIHLHVGPTNSGKTYHALKALEQAKSGVYAGPLRLLAHEVYSRMNAKGKPCALVTGEERRIPDDESIICSMISCTVEMIDVNNRMDVAVIDEIQMLGSLDRGWAWTQALLGVRAREVHLCGEERAIPMVKELVALIGDSLEIHRYERLTPLEMDPYHLNGNLRQLRKGDCIVSFSVLGIHALRQQIEKATGKNVAIVYGSLPPETRAQQARLFNDPDNNYDFLVASDAIGMGLNLSIKRIIFESSQKNDGTGMKTLSTSQIRQIGGRAGRYRTSHQDTTEAASNLDATTPEVEATTEVVEPQTENSSPLSLPALQSSHSVKSQPDLIFDSEAIEEMTVRANPEPVYKSSIKIPLSPPDTSTTGLVTTLYPFDYPVINRGMSLEPEPIASAGVHPPSSIVERFTSYFPPGTPFSYILLRLNEISQMNPRFHLCGLRDALHIADQIHKVPDLSTADRIIFCAAPISRNNNSSLLVSLARCVAEQKGGSLLELPPNDLDLELLELPVAGERRYLEKLENLHKDIILYLWLSYRFSGVFSTRQLAFYVKEMVEKKIEETLEKLSFSESARHKIRKAREQAALEEMRKTYEQMREEGKEEDSAGEKGEDNADVILSSDEGREDSETEVKVEENDGSDTDSTLELGDDSNAQHKAGDVEVLGEAPWKPEHHEAELATSAEVLDEVLQKSEHKAEPATSVDDMGEFPTLDTDEALHTSEGEADPVTVANTGDIPTPEINALNDGGRNWVALLEEHKSRSQAPEPTYRFSKFGRDWCCELILPWCPEATFGGRHTSSQKKQVAKSNAAKEAVGWLQANNTMSENGAPEMWTAFQARMDNVNHAPSTNSAQSTSDQALAKSEHKEAEPSTAQDSMEDCMTSDVEGLERTAAEVETAKDNLGRWDPSQGRPVPSFQACREQTTQTESRASDSAG